MATYRQLSWVLRFHGPDGIQRLSVRPRQGKAGTPFLDDDSPTLIELSEGDQVDIAQWLKIGAITRYDPPPAPVPAPESPEGGE